MTINNIKITKINGIKFDEITGFTADAKQTTIAYTLNGKERVITVESEAVEFETNV